MTGKELVKYIEDWAPLKIAWEKDNVGLQVGSLDRKVKNILLCLELTMKVLDDAEKKECNFIISHHPLLFHPLNKIDLQKDKNSKLIERLIKQDLTLYSSHTNLDFTKDGVSFELAKKLKLKNIKFLLNLKSNQFKIIVFVPEDHLEKVADEIFKAGGGIIGDYSNCSFRVKGEGTFKGNKHSNPAIGKKGIYEKVEEVRLEVLADKWKLKDIISALLKFHPYEEPAYDIYPLENENLNYGIGALGDLDKELNEEEFLKYISQKLRIKNFRYTRSRNKIINKVAVCGGSGSEFIGTAIKNGADAYITGDIKYHSFHETEGKILLIDAGHYETEIYSLDEIKRRLNLIIEKKSSIKVFKYKGSTNPVNFYNN